MKSFVIDDAYIDENILSIIHFLQKEELGYGKKYEEALLKVMDSYLLDEDLPPDEQWEIIRIFADLRRDIKYLSKPETRQEEQTPFIRAVSAEYAVKHRADGGEMA